MPRTSPRTRPRTRRTFALALLAPLLLGPPGCALEIDTGLPRGDAVELHTDRFAWGLVGGSISVEPVGLVRVQESLELSDLLFTALTLGIYCPTSATVWLERPGPGFERVQLSRPAASAPGLADEGDVEPGSLDPDRDERSSWYGRARLDGEDPLAPVSSDPSAGRGATGRSGR